jgi:hypothetical protein
VSFYDGLVPKREEIQWEYFDASRDPRARSTCAVPDSVRDELLALGFRPLGHARAVLRARSVEIFNAVWKDEDGRVFASLGAAGEVELGTLFEDGTLVKTLQGTLGHWFDEGAGVLQHWPGTQHFYELAEGPVAAVVERHRERVKSIEKTAPVVSGAMKVHFAMRLRVAELRDARIREQMILTLWLTFLLSTAFTVGAEIVWLRTHARHSPGVVALICVAAFLVARLPANRAARWWISPWLVLHFRRPPPLRTAKSLLEMAETIRSSLAT